MRVTSQELSSIKEFYKSIRPEEMNLLIKLMQKRKRMLKTAEIEEIYSKTSANRHLSRLQKKGFVYKIKNGEYFIPRRLFLEKPAEGLAEEYQKYQKIKEMQEKAENLRKQKISLKETLKDIGNNESYFFPNKKTLKNKAIRIYNSDESLKNKIKKIDKLDDQARKEFWKVINEHDKKAKNTPKRTKSKGK